MCNHDRDFVKGACGVNGVGERAFHKVETGGKAGRELVGEREEEEGGENGDGEGSTLAGWTTADLESRSGAEEFEFGVGSLEGKGIAWVAT